MKNLSHHPWRFLRFGAALPFSALLIFGLACSDARSHGGDKNGDHHTPDPAKQESGSETSAQDHNEHTAASGLQILNPSASILTEMGALYFTVANHEENADRLIRVETPAAESAEIHISTEVDGIVRMRHQPDGLEIPANSTLSFAPGGSHVMFLGAKLPATDPVPVTLHFEHAGAVELEAPLASLEDMGSGEDHQAGHGGHEGH